MLASLQAAEQTKQQDAAAAADAWTRYDRQLQRAGSYVPFQNELGGIGYRKRFAAKYLVWDCASTHGAVRIASARKKSFWHQYAEKVGMRGVIFLPPRTPTLNPIELVFGFIKHQVRKHCPDEGYKSASLIQAIHNAFRRVTPTMIRNWVKKAGYRFASPAPDVAAAVPPALPQIDDEDAGPVPMEIDGEEEEEEEEKDAAAAERDEDHAQDNESVDNDVPLADKDQDCYSAPGARFHRKRTIICMDEHGTVVREKKRRSVTFDRLLDKKLQTNLEWSTTVSMQNVAPIVKDMPSVAFAKYVPYKSEEEAFAGVGRDRRWAGLGPEPERLQETMPESITKIQDGTLWEIDGIVEHKRGRNGINDYLVRYKGYGPEYDEWMADDHLSTATGAIKEYWARLALQT
jgi:hypothetical protein